MPAANVLNLPGQPCVRPDAVLFAPVNGPLRIAVSARHVVTIPAPPQGTAQWLAGIDGTVRLADVLATAPLGPDQARYLLGELDRAGLLLDASTGVPFRAEAQVQRDALRLAAQARGGAIRSPSPLPPPTRVWVCGTAEWVRPLAVAVSHCPAIRASAELPVADMVVVIGTAFDPRSAEHASRALALGIPHLCVEVSAVDAVVAPVTIPGRTACRRCWALQVDEPADDLAARAYEGRCPAPPRLPAHHRAMVIALALEHTLRAVEILQGRLAAEQADQEHYLDLRLASITRRAVRPHPACGCVRLAA